MLLVDVPIERDKHIPLGSPGQTSKFELRAVPLRLLCVI